MSEPALPLYMRREIRLAIEAIGVPRPPMFVPRIRPWPSEEKPESISAAGTLLRAWVGAAETIRARPDIRFDRRE